jgi:predicted lipid-binding transport protein (Tim44 family)
VISSVIAVEHSRRVIGSRGSRRTAGVRPTSVVVQAVPDPPAPLPKVAPASAAPREHGLVGGLLHVLLTFFQRRGTADEPPTLAPAPAPVPARTSDRSRSDSSFERGLRDIRRTDPGFDPTRFTGYAAMVFRTAQAAWTTRDMTPLRDRLTPEMHETLQAQCDQIRSSHRVNRIDEIEIVATITEAWQESGRDYVTAHINGSVVDYMVDEANVLVDGSKTVPRGVEEFWTFTRPEGLNFWMLSAIQA